MPVVHEVVPMHRSQQYPAIVFLLGLALFMRLWGADVTVTDASDVEVGTYTTLSAALAALPGSPSGTPLPCLRAHLPNQACWSFLRGST